MGMTFAQKALARAAGKDYVDIGEIVMANVDVAMMDELPADDAISKGRAVKKAGTHGEPDKFGVAMRKGDKDLHKLINDGYKKLMADPYWQELQKKYLSK